MKVNTNIPKNLQNFLRDNKILMIIILLAIFLRLFYYMGILRGDDVSYFYLAHELASGHLETSLWGGQERVGLYYPAAILIGLFGTSEFVATLFPLLASIFTAVFIYGIGFILHNKVSGLLAAFLWTVFHLDVFLATQLLPDGPTAMAVSGTIFFFLYAGCLPRSLARFTWYLLSALFAIWAFLIKESTITIGLVVLGLFLYQNIALLKTLSQVVLDKYVNGKKRLLASILLTLFLIALGKLLTIQPPVFVNNLELTSSDISFAWLLGRSNSVQVGDSGAYWNTNRPIFTPETAPEILTEPSLGERITIFDPIIPLFLVATIYGLTYQKREFYVPLIWFFLSFFYLEWGSYPRGLSLPNLFIYTPITHWIDQRNLILISVPAIIVIALFLSELFSRVSVLRAILISTLLTIFVVLALHTPIYSNVALKLIYLAIIILLIATVYSPFLLRSHRSSRPRYQFYAITILVTFSIASLFPSNHFSVSDYYKEQARRENLRQILVYLSTQPSLPIFGDGAVSWLDVYSGFELGYDHLEQGLQYPATRVIKERSILYQTGGFKVLYGCNRPVEDFEDWPFMEFGDSIGPKTCVSLVRIYPSENLASELAKARKQVAVTPTKENIDLYLAAAMQSENVKEVINALANYVTYFPNQTPIIEASSLIAESALTQLDTKTINLIDIFANCNSACSWEFGPLLTPHVDQVEGQEVLSINIDKKTDESQPIDIRINLKQDTAYILQFELRSFAPFDLVRFDGVEIPDSYPNSWNRDLEWAKYTIVFVTPHWAEGRRDVMMELARVYDRGNIDFRQIFLIEINGTSK